uniref:BTB domain-containing protein n=1 Tax=Parascaris univalens TaxID=6257 RepID=A0A915AHX1_PARUN
MTAEFVSNEHQRGSKTNVSSVLFLRRFHCTPRSRQRKRSIFFYDKFTTSFALRTFDWICAWESAENESDDGDMLVQRIDLDDDPVCAQVKFILKLTPTKNNLPVVSVESEWIYINAKWSDVGHENATVAKLFSTLRQHEYAWGTVDALIEMQFHRETFFSMKQDQLCKILGRELRYNKLNNPTNFTALDDFSRTNIFAEISDFIINTYDGELLFPRYVLALSFEYFRNLIDAEGDLHSASIPFKNSTVLQVFEFVKRGFFSLESLRDVNDELGDFIDCLVLLRPLEYEILLYNIEMLIFQMIAKNWDTIKIDNIVRLMIFTRQHVLLKLFDSLVILVADSHYNRFIMEYTVVRNEELYRLMLDHSIVWAVREQHQKLLERKTRRILRCNDANVTLVKRNC